jgi:hypothetical protein
MAEKMQRLKRPEKQRFYLTICDTKKKVGVEMKKEKVGGRRNFKGPWKTCSG